MASCLSWSDSRSFSCMTRAYLVELPLLVHLRALLVELLQVALQLRFEPGVDFELDLRQGVYVFLYDLQVDESAERRVPFFELLDVDGGRFVGASFLGVSVVSAVRRDSFAQVCFCEVVEVRSFHVCIQSLQVDLRGAFFGCLEFLGDQFLRLLEQGFIRGGVEVGQ